MKQISFVLIFNFSSNWSKMLKFTKIISSLSQELEPINLLDCLSDTAVQTMASSSDFGLQTIFQKILRPWSGRTFTKRP